METRAECSIYFKKEMSGIGKMGVYRKKIMNEGHSATYDITEDKVQTQTDF